MCGHLFSVWNSREWRLQQQQQRAHAGSSFRCGDGAHCRPSSSSSFSSSGHKHFGGGGGGGEAGEEEEPLHAEFTCPSSSSPSSQHRHQQQPPSPPPPSQHQRAAPPPHWLSEDPYRCLKLSSSDGTATKEAVKRQYRRLCLLYHPDKTRHPEATRAFLAITRAYAEVTKILE